MDANYKTVTLTEAEMEALDDGQEWYKPGDTVIVAGYMDQDGVDLNVNGETVCDGWTTWDQLPASVRWQFRVTKGQEPEDEGDYPWDDEHVSSVEGV